MIWSKANKDIIIAALVIVCLVELVVILGRPKIVPLSIDDKIQRLRESGCKLDYAALEQFAKEWDGYIESAWDYTTPEIEEYH